jgi:Zn-dependent protease
MKVASFVSGIAIILLLLTWLIYGWESVGHTCLEIGTIWSIPVRVHASLFLSGFWFSTIAAVAIAKEVPGMTVRVYWAQGFVVVAAVEVSVVLHELGGAFVAQHVGRSVNAIYLHAMGAFVAFDEPFFAFYRGGPWEMIAIAVAGPLTNAALGVACYGVARCFWLASNCFESSSSHWQSKVRSQSLLALRLAQSIGVIGFVNVDMACFYMSPVIGFDGGKVLYGLMWAVTRRRDVACFLSLAISLAIVMRSDGCCRSCCRRRTAQPEAPLPQPPNLPSMRVKIWY